MCPVDVMRVKTSLYVFYSLTIISLWLWGIMRLWGCLFMSPAKSFSGYYLQLSSALVTLLEFYDVMHRGDKVLFIYNPFQTRRHFTTRELNNESFSYENVPYIRYIPYALCRGITWTYTRSQTLNLILLCPVSTGLQRFIT